MSSDHEEADFWLGRYLTNEEMARVELPGAAAVLADTFDLERLWGSCTGGLLPDDLTGRRSRGDWPASVTLLRTWLHQQSRRVRILTQDWNEPEEEAVLEELAKLVRERISAGPVEDETHFIAEQLSASGSVNWASIYSDPVERSPTSLFNSLMSQPTSIDQHPVENQFSEALCFLISRWPSFAANVALLCSHPDDRQLQDSVAAAEMIGARTRVSLPVQTGPAPQRGFLFPDISIEGSDRTFQILLEVKVSADVHDAVVGGKQLAQPDAYAEAWRRVTDPSPARARRVATLTPDPLDLEEADPMRAASITWPQVVELIEEHEAAGAPPQLALIVSDLRTTISDLILPPAIKTADIAYVNEVGSALLEGFTAALLSEYPGTKTTGPIGGKQDYVRRYIDLEVNGQAVRLLIRITPSGARYNLPGRPATVALQFMTDSNETLPDELKPVSLGVGMVPTRNKAGWEGFRRFVDLPSGLTECTAAQLGSQLASELVAGLP